MLKYLFLTVLTTCLSISSCDNNQSQNDLSKSEKKSFEKKVKKIKEKDAVRKPDKNNLTEEDTNEIEYINQFGICFFYMTDREYENYLISSETNVKWEFDVLFKKFTLLSKTAVETLNKNNIYAIRTNKPVIAFISETNDTTIFNRKADGYFIGQIFYSENNTYKVEEGLMDVTQLEDKIKEIFKLEQAVSINVNYSESDTTEQFLNDTLYQTTKDTIF